MNRVGFKTISGIFGLVLLAIGAGVIAFNFQNVRGDIRQRASGGINCSYVGECKVGRTCLAADVTLSRPGTGNNCQEQSGLYCSSQKATECGGYANCAVSLSGGFCISVCQPNINTCGGGGCSIGYARKCNADGTGWATGCFADSRCGTIPTETTSTTESTSTTNTNTQTTTGTTTNNTGGTNIGENSSVNLCASEGVNLNWTDKSGIARASGATNVPFNPTERFYASNCRANAPGWDLLVGTDPQISNVVFSIANASGKDPGLVSSYVDAEVGSIHNTLYMTCRKNGNSCGTIQLVRGAIATFTPTPTLSNTPTPTLTSTPTPTVTLTPTPTSVPMCVNVKAWVRGHGNGCLPVAPGSTNTCVAGEWKEVSTNELNGLVRIGDTVRFTVAGANGVFLKARFSANGGDFVETTNKYGSDFYWDYVIPRSGNFSIRGELFR